MQKECHKHTLHKVSQYKVSCAKIAIASAFLGALSLTYLLQPDRKGFSVRAGKAALRYDQLPDYLDFDDPSILTFEQTGSRVVTGTIPSIPKSDLPIVFPLCRWATL